jgi:hypothetical protein
LQVKGSGHKSGASLHLAARIAVAHAAGGYAMMPKPSEFSCVVWRSG